MAEMPYQQQQALNSLKHMQLGYPSVGDDPGATDTFLMTIEACAMDESNWLRRRERGDKAGDLDVESYKDACYRDFLQLMGEPMWSDDIGSVPCTWRRFAVVSSHTR